MHVECGCFVTFVTVGVDFFLLLLFGKTKLLSQFERTFHWFSSIKDQACHLHTPVHPVWVKTPSRNALPAVSRVVCWCPVIACFQKICTFWQIWPDNPATFLTVVRLVELSCHIVQCNSCLQHQAGDSQTLTCTAICNSSFYNHLLVVKWSFLLQSFHRLCR